MNFILPWIPAFSSTMAVFGPRVTPPQLLALHCTPSHWMKMRRWKRLSSLQVGSSGAFASTPQRGLLVSSGITVYYKTKYLCKVLYILLAQENISHNAMVTRWLSSQPECHYAIPKRLVIADSWYIATRYYMHLDVECWLARSWPWELLPKLRQGPYLLIVSWK